MDLIMDDRRISSGRLVNNLILWGVGTDSICNYKAPIPYYRPRITNNSTVIYLIDACPVHGYLTSY